jgi:hypothetical protein
MTQEITLNMPARLFESTGKQLARRRMIIPRGSQLTVIEKEMMIYDHKDQLAIKFLYEGVMSWILVAEAGIVLDA